MNQQLRVVYNNPDTGQRYILRRHNTPDVNLYAARKVLELLHRSYEVQFEIPDCKSPKGSLPNRTVWNHFRPDLTSSVLRQNARMNRDIGNGSAYWHVNPQETNIYEDSFKDGKQYGFMAGLVKTSPSRASQLQKYGLTKPDCFINDIVVDPSWEYSDATRRDQMIVGHRIGTMALHAALKFGEYKPSKIVALDAFTDNDVNSWYERIGLEAKPEIVLPGYGMGRIVLPQTRFESQRGQNIGSHIAALEARTPWLAEATAA